MSEPARRIRQKPRVDFDWLNDRMDGEEGSVTLHWTAKEGFREDKVEVRLFERAPARDSKV
jgi:hypothetical protein